MAEPDCPICAAAGYRACDLCGNPVFEPVIDSFGIAVDLCAYCVEDRISGGAR